MSGGSASPPTPESRRMRWLWGALIGAAIGFSLGTAAYLVLVPVLEASTGIVRELQGLTWNLVPGLTIIGGIGGGLAGWRRAGRAAHGRT